MSPARTKPNTAAAPSGKKADAASPPPKKAGKKPGKKAGKKAASKENASTASTTEAKAKSKGQPQRLAGATLGKAKAAKAGPTKKRTATADPGAAADGPRDVADVGRAGAPAQGRELRARGRKTMRKLLDAGIEVFSTRGYHAARVDDIVKAAATSHGTFYLYFANKEDLFQALVTDVAEELAAVTASLGTITSDAAGRAELRAWLDRFTEMYAHYGPIIRSWTEAEIGSSEAGRVGTDVLGDLATGLGTHISKARQKQIDPTIAALAVIAMIERLNYFVVSGQLHTDRDTMLDTLTDISFNALFSSEN